ncbi:DNA-binding MurR/RpiR family transcriptional regulator [Natronobacillus azotifigens]|uniref:MurR/RpiR family transcriptional regulator n=1 Tax=Natronobacillus azotifigens TaxID=472978 RepID=A0A9J6RFF4_9BACI|nr:MurR/RpiR family transcriptional regulator [Natronobacillus azotifigens]MCZ0704490.1 MurR/RpiR family transcriptional regulator [Natronobacillus azotifigens]
MYNFDWNTSYMSPTQVKIANYIQKNTQKVLLSTEAEIAAATNVSIASVSRFWRSVDYLNFKDFKKQMQANLEVSPAGKWKDLLEKVDKQSSLQFYTLESAVNHLHQTMEYVSNHAFKKAVNLITEARKIYIYSPGPSRGLANLMDYRISRFNCDVSIISEGGSELFEQMMHFTKEDVVVIFGFVRLLPEAKVLLDHAEEASYRTIILTDQLISDFSKKADSVLFASRGEEHAFHSMIAPTFLIENLIISIGMKSKETNIDRLEQLSELRRRYANELPR